MKFIGLTPDQLWGLLGGLGLIITLLYLLKLRRRRVTVPFSPIWSRVLQTQARTSWLDRLKRLVSWLLQLAFAAMIVFAIADPRPEEEDLVGRNLVLLIDTSASMSAIDVSGGVDRLDIARQEAQKVLDSMGPNDAVMLVTMDGQLRPLTPFVKQSAILSQQLKDLRATATPADIRQALRFVRDAVRDKAEVEIYLLSDGAFADDFKEAAAALPPQAKLRHVKTGESGQNVAITAFNVRRYLANRQDYEIYIEVRSYFPREVEVELQLLADGALADIKPVKLPPNGAELLFFPDQGFGGRRLEARVQLKTADARDVFPLDDAAYAVLPSAKKAAVALVTEGNLFLHAPLLLNPNLTVEEISPSRWDPAIAQRADVVIFDDFVPPQLPDKGAFLFLHPNGDASPWPVLGQVEKPVITTRQKKHPLLRWVALEDLNISKALQLKTGPKDEVAAAAYGAPMIISRVEEGRRMIAVAFDLRDSDLPLRVALPVLMLNSLDFLQGDEASLVPTYRTGQAWSIPVSKQADAATITPPDGGDPVQVPIYEGRAIFYGDQVGFYTITVDGEEALLAANLADPKESRIEPPEALQLDDRQIEAGTGPLLLVRREYWILLVLAALLLLLLEWVSYNRRWTV
jgi:hypothetical protein